MDAVVPEADYRERLLLGGGFVRWHGISEANRHPWQTAFWQRDEAALFRNRGRIDPP